MDPKHISRTSFCNKEIDNVTDNPMKRYILDNLKLKTNIKIILEERNKLIDSLNELSFIIKVYPSDSNFILIKVDDAYLRYKQLIEKGIVLRNRSKELLCDNCLRITIGTPYENELLIKNFKEL